MDLRAADLLPVTDPDAVGDLRAWRDVELPGLDRRADISVWLPPGAAVPGPRESTSDGSPRYPVLYLHDGDNLFLRATTFDGARTWRVGEAMTALAADGLPAIVVGIPCSPTDRAGEYTQYPHPEHGGGRAAGYATFLTDHLKPAIDATLRTKPGPEHTITAGSSLGGVISAYLWQTRPDVFGGAGLFSTAFWFSGERALSDLAAAAPLPRVGGRVYLDVGGREGDDDAIREAYVADTERAVAALRRAGVPLRYVYDSVAIHHEAAWAERFPAAARWLLRGWRA